MNEYQNINKIPPVTNAPTGDIFSEVKELESKLAGANLPIGLRENAMKSVQRLYRSAKFGTYSAEFPATEKYIDWVTRIPFGRVTEDNLDLKMRKP